MGSRKLLIRCWVASAAVLLLGVRALYPQVPPAADVRFAPPGQGESYAPPILGVSTHFGALRSPSYTSAPLARQQIKQIGANSYRDGIAWASFRFADPAHPVLWQKRKIMDFLPMAGALPLIVLGAPAMQLSAQGNPFTEGQLAQFAAYAKGTVQMTGRYQPIFEVWNEFNMRVGNAKPNGPLSGEGDPSDARAAVHYAPLAKIGVKAVKAANPNAKVVIGAVGDDPGWRWTQGIIGYGALNGADGLSVHLYNHCAPPAQRNAPEMIKRLQSLQTLLSTRSGNKTVPVYVTEFGWPTGTGKCALPLDRQAYNFAHYILQSSVLPWLRGSWIYELKDEGPDRAEIEDNFGIYTFDDKPKPAACFVREARAIVAGAKSVELKEARPGLFALRAVMDGHQVAVVWTSDTSSNTRLRLAGQPKSARMMCGAPVDPKSEIPVSQVPLVAEFDIHQAVAISFNN